MKSLIKTIVIFYILCSVGCLELYDRTNPFDPNAPVDIQKNKTFILEFVSAEIWRPGAVYQFTKLELQNKGEYIALSATGIISTDDSNITLLSDSLNFGSEYTNEVGNIGLGHLTARLEFNASVTFPYSTSFMLDVSSHDSTIKHTFTTTVTIPVTIDK